jgi:toxin FitB
LSYLLDTNVVSELRKRERTHPHVRRWWRATPPEQVYLSVLVLGELRAGIERVRPRDQAQARALESWHASVASSLRGRLLVVDEAITDCWGRLISARPLPPIDALLAATALVHGLTLVTRNTRDVAATGVGLFDPFATA